MGGAEAGFNPDRHPGFNDSAGEASLDWPLASGLIGSPRFRASRAPGNSLVAGGRNPFDKGPH
ncbi:hypothetical protein BTW08_01545 [Salinicola sp. MH3R3-1]|nr:hypothetical protein BTW08_01545 [Salinicola sp. MH3R3-1]